MIGAFAALVGFVAAGVGAIVMVRRRPADPVTQFRRQIDALSAESRRTVVTGRSDSVPSGVQTISDSAAVSTSGDASPAMADTGEGASLETSPDDASTPTVPGAPDGT